MGWSRLSRFATYDKGSCGDRHGFALLEMCLCQHVSYFMHGALQISRAGLLGGGCAGTCWLARRGEAEQAVYVFNGTEADKL